MDFNTVIKAGLSAATFENLNFFPNSESNLLAQLRATIPNGTTSLYDAIFVGIKRLLELYAILTKFQTSSIWNFVHIIVTDGEDTNSKNELKELLGMMMFIGVTLQKAILKTWFIGVDIDSNKQAQKDIMVLSAVGGDNLDFMNISNLEISKVFEKIKVELGMSKQINMIKTGNVIAVAQKNVMQINVKKERYVVLFTLDKSGSMEGSKWTKLCQGVESFMKGLDDQDLIGCTTFNSEVMILDNEIPRPLVSEDDDDEDEDEDDEDEDEDEDEDDDDEDEDGNPDLILLNTFMALSLQKK